MYVNSMMPMPRDMVGKIPVWHSGPWTFSPFTLLASIDYSIHTILKSAGIEVDFLNFKNAFNGKTTYSDRSRMSFIKNAPVLSGLLLPVLDDYISVGIFPKESSWRTLHKSIVAHNPSHELESACNYLAKCDEFTELLRNSHETMDNVQRDKLIMDFLGFEHPSKIGYPDKMKLADLILTETTLCALAKVDLALNQLSESDRKYRPISYISPLLNPISSPIKQLWINLKNELNFKSFRELSDFLQDKQSAFDIANVQSANDKTKFDYTQIRKWSSGTQNMKWATAKLLETLIAEEAKACVSRELNAIARILTFLERFIALSSGLDLKQHEQSIRDVLLKRYQSRWHSELENLI